MIYGSYTLVYISSLDLHYFEEKGENEEKNVVYFSILQYFGKHFLNITRVNIFLCYNNNISFQTHFLNDMSK